MIIITIISSLEYCTSVFVSSIHVMLRLSLCWFFVENILLLLLLLFYVFLLSSTFQFSILLLLHVFVIVLTTLLWLWCVGRAESISTTRYVMPVDDCYHLFCFFTQSFLKSNNNNKSFLVCWHVFFSLSFPHFNNTLTTKLVFVFFQLDCSAFAFYFLLNFYANLIRQSSKSWRVSFFSDRLTNCR